VRCCRERALEGVSIHGLRLGPKQDIDVGIPLRESWPCYIPDGFTSFSGFYVEESFRGHTKWIYINEGRVPPVDMNEPVERGTFGAVCPD
jgi:hypothetical protein